MPARARSSATRVLPQTRTRSTSSFVVLASRAVPTDRDVAARNLPTSELTTTHSLRRAIGPGVDQVATPS